MTTNTKDRTHYDTKLGEWVSESGNPVCQDHAHLEPCPYNHGRKKGR